MSEDKTYSALFLCTGNSARSILGEAILNRLGAGRFKAYSAGSNPAGAVNPFAIALLEERGYPVDGLRSKSWEEFAGPDAPDIDFVFTVCDSAGEETCPVWPGHPVTAHWGIPDPAAVGGTDDEKRAAFETAYDALRARIDMFLNLKLDTDDTAALRRQLGEIGRAFPQSA
ncbi:MAG: arsenate reductase ArsC [Alphaproteobacteria bacterium]|nr:MAG: arsenate reductase ArsC [Alphaproteobacteria bacterium]